MIKLNKLFNLANGLIFGDDHIHPFEKAIDNIFEAKRDLADAESKWSRFRAAGKIARAKKDIITFGFELITSSGDDEDARAAIADGIDDLACDDETDLALQLVNMPFMTGGTCEENFREDMTDVAFDRISDYKDRLHGKLKALVEGRMLYIASLQMPACKTNIAEPT